MTTAAQVKKMVQPVLAQHGDLALVGRWLYVKPVCHYARAILIGRTAYADDIEPRWAVVHLFEAQDFFSIGLGRVPRQRALAAARPLVHVRSRR